MEKTEKLIRPGDYYIIESCKEAPLTIIYRVDGYSEQFPEFVKLMLINRGSFPTLLATPSEINKRMKKISKLKAFMLRMLIKL